ncbi:hypothetical protein SLNHY_4476 [Streptomyces albus]|nr:hypothetical protein SLNHY_4476 [Streptomyces albus]
MGASIRKRDHRSAPRPGVQDGPAPTAPAVRRGAVAALPAPRGAARRRADCDVRDLRAPGLVPRPGSRYRLVGLLTTVQ